MRRVVLSFSLFASVLCAVPAQADVAPANDAKDVISLITREAASHGMPAEFALKVARRESGLRCDAYNPKDGTHGLYQLKPATARGLGFTGDTSALRTCGAGLTFGMKHLALCWQQEGGNWTAADWCHRRGLRY
jgi:soluble lytic murein transglycosylase-like protein